MTSRKELGIRETKEKQIKTNRFSRLLKGKGVVLRKGYRLLQNEAALDEALDEQKAISL